MLCPMQKQRESHLVDSDPRTSIVPTTNHTGVWRPADKRPLLFQTQEHLKQYLSAQTDLKVRVYHDEYV